MRAREDIEALVRGMKYRVPSVPLGRRPKVSVVIPSYNYGRYIDDAISSALRQTEVDVDVTVIDDASTDGTERVVRRWVASDSRVLLISHSSNRGHIATFNECLAAGSGPYVVKLDADDVLTPGQLGRAAALLDSHPEVGMVYGRASEWRGQESDNRAGTETVRSWSVWPGAVWLEARCRTGRNVILQPEVMLRRSVLDRTGGHREELPASSDFHLWLRIARIADIGRVNQAVQGRYRIHDASMQRTVHSGRSNDLRARADAFDLFFAEDGRTLDQADYYHRLSRRALSREAVDLAWEVADHPDGETCEVARLLALAQDLDPASLWSVRFAQLQRRLRSGRESPGLRAVRELKRDIQGRARWRCWQLTGL